MTSDKQGKITQREDGTFSIECDGKIIDGFATIIEAGEELEKMLYGEEK